MHAGLHLTHGCNLRCTYCYTGEKFGIHMDRETAMKSLDFLLDSSAGFLTLTFFGGEPTMRFDILKEVVLAARARVASGETKVERVHFRLVTNGTLLTREMLEFFREHDVVPTLSIDGCREAHEANRPQVGGKGSFDQVMEKVPLLLEYFPYTKVNVTIAPASARFVARSFEFLLDTGFRHIVASLAFDAPWSRSSLDTLAGEYEKALEIYVARHRAGERFHFTLFDDKIKSRALGPQVASECCGIGLRTVAIAPSGRLYPCVSFVQEDGCRERPSALGDIETGFDAVRQERFLAASHVERAQCAGCALVARCSNHCGCTNQRLTGDPAGIHPVLCEHERILIPIADRAAEILWAERNESFLRKIYDPAFAVSSYIEDRLARARKGA